MLNPRTIIRIIGLILITEGIFMWLSIPVGLIFRENDVFQFLISGAITSAVGAWPFSRLENHLLSSTAGMDM